MIDVPASQGRISFYSILGVVLLDFLFQIVFVNMGKVIFDSTFYIVGWLSLHIQYRKRNYVREILIRKHYGRYEYAGKAIIGSFFQPILLWLLVIGFIGFLLLMAYNIIFR